MGRILCVVMVIVLVLAIGLAGVGFYREWLQLTMTEPENGATEIRLRLDRNKVSADFTSVEQQVGPKGKPEGK